MENRVINPWTWQDRFGFVQAKEVIGAERTLYCAGQTSVDEHGQPLHEGEMQAQAMQALDNLETVVGARLAQSGVRQAATLLGVMRLARPELLIEIEATAVR